MKKLVSIVLALALVLLCVGAAFADGDGSITLTNATKGETYEAYLIFTAQPSDPDNISAGVSYTATAAQVAVTGFSDVFDTFVNASGSYTITQKSGVSDNAVITFIKENINSLKQGSAISGTETTDSQLVFSNLNYGYYYISSSLGSLVTIDTAAKDATVVDKNPSNPEGPDKKITAEASAINTAQDQTNVSLTANDASVDTVESFKVTFNATNWAQAAETNAAGTGDGDKVQITEYNFKDTPTGLDIIADTVHVYVYDTAASNDITSTISDIAVNDTTGVLTFTIPWVDDDDNSLYATNADKLIPVIVTYDATVNEDAAVRTAPNYVEIKYNNDTDVGHATTVTYTYKFKLLKVDENGSPLDGAEFELYYGSTASDSAAALTFVKDDATNTYRFDSAGAVTHIAPTGTNAEALIIGLDNASYMLREVVVPNGYNKIADTAVTSLTKETYDGTDASTVVAAVEITVENNKGTELPSTGGIGTTIFYILGGLLVIGAAVILVARRKAHD